MTHYLIEFRFQGKAKAEIRQMIATLDNKFHLGIFASRRPVPHITLAGPLTTNSETQMVRDFISVCQSTPFCSFRVNGFGYFKNPRVVFIDIVASQKLDEFRWNLVQKLKGYCNLRDFDYNRDFNYHATLAMRLDQGDFDAVKRYIEKQEPLKFKYFLIRATIIKNSKILYEYDFLQRKLLNRAESLDRRILAVTMKLLKDFFDGKYDPNRNIHIKPPAMGSSAPQSSFKPRKKVKSGLINEITQFFKKLFRFS